VASVYERIDDRLAAFLERQPVFFVATAPLDGDGHVNVSPKGYAGTFAIVDDRTVAYLDLVGSGAETIAHLRENGRITLMFCAFEGKPKILRLYGHGRVVQPDDPEFPDLRARFRERHGVRTVILVHVTRIADSCGYAVPLMAFESERDVLTGWHARRDDERLAAFQAEKNAESIDGLPALRVSPVGEPS
jgi:predicted pyridoxine 5'-phosphate oxidase superfamily flavin-nucleotide-binding protein